MAQDHRRLLLLLVLLLLECICGELGVNGYGYDTGGHQLVVLLLGQLLVLVLQVLLLLVLLGGGSTAGRALEPAGKVALERVN